MNIIDECFTPLQPYEHREEGEVNSIVTKNIGKRNEDVDSKNGKCEKILYQCFEPQEPTEPGSNETIVVKDGKELKRLKVHDEIYKNKKQVLDLSEATEGIAGSKPKVEIIQNVKIRPLREEVLRIKQNEAKRVARIKKVDDEFQTEIGRRKRPAIQKRSVEINDKRIVLIKVVDEEFQFATKEDRDKSSIGEYLNDSEKRQFEDDLKAIQKLKNNLRRNGMIRMDRNINNTNDKKVQGPVTPSAFEIQDEKTLNQETINVKLEDATSETADEIHKYLEKQGKVQYREVLDIAKLHYKQLENLELNNNATNQCVESKEREYETPETHKPEERQLGHYDRVTKIVTVDEESNPLSTKEEQVKLNNPDEVNSVNEEPFREQEDQQAISFKEKHVENHEPVNNQTNIDNVESQEEKKSYEKRESDNFLNPMGPKAHFNDSEKFYSNSVSAIPPTDQEDDQLSHKHETTEQQEKENVKINIDIVETDIEQEKPAPNSKEEKVELHETDKLNVNAKQEEYDGKKLIDCKENADRKKLTMSIEKKEPQMEQDHADYDASKSIKANSEALNSRDLVSATQESKKALSTLEMDRQNNFTADQKVCEKSSQTEVERMELNSLNKTDEQQKYSKSDEAILTNNKVNKNPDDVQPEQINIIPPVLSITSEQFSDNKATKEEQKDIGTPMTELVHYTPQIYTQKLKFEEAENMTELVHYTPQIYTQKLNFGDTKNEDLLELQTVTEPQKEQIEEIKPETLHLLDFVKPNMTELNHYTPKIYMDAILQIQKNLRTSENFEDTKQELELDKQPVLEEQKTNHKEPKRVDSLSYEELKKPAKKEKGVRKNDIVFAHIDASAIDKSLKKMLHSKHRKVNGTKAPKLYYKATTQTKERSTQTNYLDIKVPFDDAIESLKKLDKALRIHYKKFEAQDIKLNKNSKKEDQKQSVANAITNDLAVLQTKYDNFKEKWLQSTRDVGTSLINELKSNIKERTPAGPLNIGKHLTNIRSPSRRQSNQRNERDECAKYNKHYDKIASEWIKNEDNNVSRRFDEITRQQKNLFNKDTTGKEGSIKVNRYATRICRTPKIEDDGFLANTSAEKKRDHESAANYIAVAEIENENNLGKPETINTEDIDDAIKLERKNSEMYIATSETAPSFHNEEHIIIGEMSRGPFYKEEEEALEEIASAEPKYDYSYHRKAITKLISNITQLRGFIDDGKEETLEYFNTFNEQKTRHAMLYKAVAETVNKAESIQNEVEREKTVASDSDTTFYSAEDVSSHNVIKKKDDNLDLSAKITLNPSEVNTSNKSPKNEPNRSEPNPINDNIKFTTTVFNSWLNMGMKDHASTELSPKKKPMKTKQNSTLKNIKLTTTVFNSDMRASYDSGSSSAGRNNLKAERLRKAARNYSYDSTSKPFDSEDGPVTKEGLNTHKVLQNMPQIRVQWDCVSQTNKYETPEQQANEHNDKSEPENKATTKIGDKEVVDSYLLPREEHNDTADDEKQQAMARIIANYVKTDPEPEKIDEEGIPEVKQWIDPSYTNTVQINRNNEEQNSLPHVEQITWHHGPQENTAMPVIGESEPNQNITEEITQQEMKYENQKILNRYETNNEHSRQPYNSNYNNFCTTCNSKEHDQASNETTDEESKANVTNNYEFKTEQFNERLVEHEHREKYDTRNNETQTETTEQLANLWRNYQNANNPQQNNQHYLYDEQKTNQNYTTVDEESNVEPNKYSQNENFSSQQHHEGLNEKVYDLTKTPLEHQSYQQNPHSAQLETPPDIQFWNSTRLIQKPTNQTISLPIHHYQNCKYVQQKGFIVPIYEESEQNEIPNKTYNSRLEKLRALENSYYNRANEKTELKETEENALKEIPEPTEKALKYQQDLETSEQQQYYSNSCDYCYYNDQNNGQNPSGTSERQLNTYYYDLSDDQTHSQSLENMTLKQYNQYYSSKLTENFRDQYYDANSQPMHHSCDYYKYYSTAPDYALLKEYEKQYGHLHYPPPYTHATICPLGHNHDEKCEHCCAEDTSRPNEIETSETEDVRPKETSPRTKFAKPKMRKRRSSSRGGITEAVIPRQLEFNTSINLPSLDEENIKLSELLDRVRYRNRIFKMVEVLKPYDPSQMVNCNDKEPLKPPAKPKTAVAPGKCPKSTPEPCKIPCPKTTDPCDKTKPKDPCNQCCGADKVTLLLYVAKKGRDKTARNPKKFSSQDTSGKSDKTKSGVTQMLFAALVKIKKYVDGSETSLQTTDSSETERKTFRSLKRAELVAERFKPKGRKNGKCTPIEYLRDGMKQARKHVVTGFPMTFEETDDVYYDARL